LSSRFWILHQTNTRFIFISSAIISVFFSFLFAGVYQHGVSIKHFSCFLHFYSAAVLHNCFVIFYLLSFLILTVYSVTRMCDKITHLRQKKNTETAWINQTSSKWRIGLKEEKRVKNYDIKCYKYTCILGLDGNSWRTVSY